MRFSQLITALKNGKAGLQSHQLLHDPEIISGASIELATSNQISFLEPISSLILKFDQSSAGAVLLPPNIELCAKADKKGIAWAVMNNPRLAFAESLNLLNPKPRLQAGIHPTAVIEENVTLEEEVYVGAHVCIGKNSHIGAGTVIHPGVVIYQEVVIGKESELHANCVIHSGTKLGDQCVINSNAVIGSEGFGFVPTEKGWYKMPQTGLVKLGNEVEIGCCSAIDRPAVGETQIGTGTKIDNLVQIGHGVTTGKSCAMASQVGVAGGASLGNNVILAGQVGVSNHVKVGDGVIASSKCGIHTDIESGAVISGFPAMPNRQWLKCSANFKKLPEISKSLRDLNRHSSQ